jgi:hypothetical protein
MRKIIDEVVANEKNKKKEKKSVKNSGKGSDVLENSPTSVLEPIPFLGVLKGVFLEQSWWL